MNKNKAFLLFCMALILCSSCSKRLSGVSWNFLDKNKLDVQEVDFEYFSGKAKINYKDDEHDLKARANVRIRKDSVIWIAFSAIGIQGARCLINRDSITIINLMKKEYYVFNYDSLSKQFNFKVDYDAIQAVALGNLIYDRSRSDEVMKEDNYYILMQESGSVNLRNFVNPKTMKVERVEMKENPSNNSAVVRYNDFHMIEGNAFPFSGIISLFYQSDAGILNTVIEFEYNKAEIEDRELKFPFNIPKRYERK